MALDGANRGARLNLAAHYALYGHTDKARTEMTKAGGPPATVGGPADHPELGLLLRLNASAEPKAAPGGAK